MGYWLFTTFLYLYSIYIYIYCYLLGNSLTAENNQFLCKKKLKLFYVGVMGPFTVDR